MWTTDGFLFFLGSMSLSAAATIPAQYPTITSTPVITPSPDVLLARQASDCSLSLAPAMTLDGVAYLASSVCMCGEVMAGASTTVGSDSSTTWECDVTPTRLPVSTQAPPPPVPTYVIRVEVGKQKFMVGDYNQLGLEPLMADLCDSNGCGGGDSQSFNFNWTGPLSIAQFATGSLSMTGNIDDSPVIEQALLQALNTTLLATSECTQQATVFPQPGRRSIVPMPKTISSLIPQCQITNYLQATLYTTIGGNPAVQMAQMTFQGASQNPSDLNCANILGGISTALSALPLPPIIGTAVTIGQAFCGSGEPS